VEAAATIVGIATAPAEGGVGVIRLSGSLALELARAVAPELPDPPQPRHAYFTRFTDGAGAVLDEGLVLYFQGPRSYTGEDVVELQAHGSPVLLKLMQSALLRDGRLRMAEPGEFTRRAFVNGRMDLSRAEAVADLVAAQSEAAVRAAGAQLRGALSAALAPVREAVLELRAEAEGLLSFPDEAEGAEIGLGERVSGVLRGARALLETAGRGSLLRRGARVALLGPANAGKSTLFNALVGEARALVDEEPGTTRDVLEARLELEGVPVTLLDTAGLRPDGGRLEALGQARALDAARSADLVLLVAPPGAEAAELARWRTLAEPTPTVVVWSKADLGGRAGSEEVSVSGKSGEGVDALRRMLRTRLFGEGVAQGVQVTSERHAALLRECVEALARAAQASEVSTLEVVAGELALAGEALGRVTGEDVQGELLDAVFQRFCIGK
jgi:tRNA modification GTPase